MSPHAEWPRIDVPPPLARRLVEQELVGASGNAVAITSLLVERVYTGLSRSFGQYGALALVTRAVARARGEHPLLVHVVASATTSPHVTGWSNGAAVHDTVAVTEAAVAVLASLHESLTRLIGEDLAERLLEQRDAAPVPSPTETPASPNASDA